MSGALGPGHALRAALALCWVLLTQPAQAGTQQEEALADAVRLALSNAVAETAPPRPTFADAASEGRYKRWLARADGLLARKLDDARMRADLLQTVWYEARRAGLEPELVLGLIQVESGFRKYAISTAGARGLMQVMPFWTRTIGDGDVRKLFVMRTNLRYGCTILRHYLDRENGELFMALGRYNGSRGRVEYPNAVLAAWRLWQRQMGENGKS